MPFDPNFPPDHQALNAAPFREQFQGLKALIDDLQAQLSPLLPVLTRVSSAEWTLQFAGPVPAGWQLWLRFPSNESWSYSTTLAPGDFPATDEVMAPTGEEWWQVKIVGVNGDDKAVTAFSNVISSGPVPA